MDSKELIVKFRLPSYIKGKSFADASKAINKRFEGRNDITSKNTKNELLTRLANAQEYTKSQQSEQIHAPEEVTEGQGYNEGQMFAGGFQAPSGNLPNSVGYSFNNNPTMSMDAASGNTGTSGMSNAAYGMLGSLAGQLGNSLKGNSPTSHSGLMTDKENKNEQAYEGVKSAVATAIPIAGLFKGVESLGKGLGQSIGGDKGGDIAQGFFDPFSNVMRKDTNAGEKALSVLDPVVAGIITNKKNDARRRKLMSKDSLQANSTFDDTQSYATGGPIEEYYAKNNPYFMTNPGMIPTGDYYQDLQLTPRNTAPLESINYLNPVGVNDIQRPNTNLSTSLPLQNTNVSGPSITDQALYGAKKIGNFINDNGANALRYAPLLANAYQLSKLKKPKIDRLDRLTNRYKPEYVDERQLQNIAGNEMTNSINAITQSGGSQGAVRNSILASALNKSKALSEAYVNATAANRATNDRGQQFDLGVDQVNLNQSNTEKENYARDMGNYDTQKSKLISQLGNDVGQIGKEQVFKKYPKLMGLRYDSNGEYFIKPDGTKLTAQQIKAQNPGLTPSELNELLKQEGYTSNAKGGFLKTSLEHVNQMYMKRKK